MEVIELILTAIATGTAFTACVMQYFNIDILPDAVCIIAIALLLFVILKVVESRRE